MTPSPVNRVEYPSELNVAMLQDVQVVILFNRGLMLSTPGLDPRRANIGQFRGPYDVFVMAVIGVKCAIPCGIVASALGWPVPDAPGIEPTTGDGPRGASAGGRRADGTAPLVPSRCLAVVSR